MSTTDELLDTLEGTAEQTGTTVYEINPDTRVINIPPEFLLGVESDEKSNRIYFTCPKVVGDNIDLTNLELRVNYKNANGYKGYDDITDVTESTAITGNIVFSWSLSREVTECKGTVTFTICAVKKTGVEITNEWNTVPTTGKVIEGLEVDNRDGNNIFLMRGETFIATITIQDEYGNVYTPDSGDLIVFSVKRTIDDTSIIIEKSIPVDTLKLTIQSDDTKTLAVGEYVYNVKLIKSSGEVCYVIPNSTFVLLQEVA